MFKFKNYIRIGSVEKFRMFSTVKISKVHVSYAA